MNALSAAIAAHARGHCRSIALDPVVAPPITYAELARRTAELAARLSLANAPLRPVAVQQDHGSRSALLDLALLEAGLPHLSLPLFFTATQVEHAISTSGAQALYAEPSPDLRQPEPTAPVELPDGTARITFTSGSTGAPKGICLSAGHLLTVAEAVVQKVGAGHAGRHLALLPPGVLLETVAGFYATLLAGGTYVCPPQALAGLANPFRPDFGTMARRIDEWGITSLILVPEYLSGLVSALETSGQRLERLTLVAVGGARTSPGLIARARQLGIPVRQGYGLTECASVVSLEDDARHAPGSVGTPLPHMRAEIAADGEVVLHGPTCLGTIGVEMTAAPLATGDLGRLDAQGRLWIEGRKSNLIVTSHGRNVSPEWLEETLLAEPGVLQVMIYGDGLPAPEALLVAAYPAADLASAVASANARLPEYARIARWRPAAPFSPLNGHLTGNGRLRRAAIMSAYGAGDTPFYTELERRTMPARIRFLTVPQVRAGLSGDISLETYRAYLTQAFHHVSHTVPLMRAARARLADRPLMVAALDEYIEEETGHEEWILSDIAATGGDAEAARRSSPAPATKAMVDHAYEQIRRGNPASFFGMVYVLESVSVALAQHGANSVAQRLGLPPAAFTYLTSHGAVDQDHLKFFAGLVNSLADPADREAIAAMAEDIFDLFGAMFAAIPMERADVAA